jgi:hypothetical protein
MKVTTRFDYAKIQAEKAFNLRLMLAIEGDEQPEKQRSPLNLALVLDHSGSMSGPKLRNVKEATKQLVKMLHKDDIFSLTIFDDEVTRLIPPVRIGDAHNLTRNHRRHPLRRLDLPERRLQAGLSLCHRKPQQGLDHPGDAAHRRPGQCR